MYTSAYQKMLSGKDLQTVKEIRKAYQEKKITYQELRFLLQVMLKRASASYIKKLQSKYIVPLS